MSLVSDDAKIFHIDVMFTTFKFGVSYSFVFSDMHNAIIQPVNQNCNYIVFADCRPVFDVPDIPLLAGAPCNIHIPEKTFFKSWSYALARQLKKKPSDLSIYAPLKTKIRFKRSNKNLLVFEDICILTPEPTQEIFRSDNDINPYGIK